MLINFFISVNKDGFVNMSIDEPQRDKGKWKFKSAYVNSMVYDFTKNVVEQNCMTYDDDPEPISMNMVMSKNK